MNLLSVLRRSLTRRARHADRIRLRQPEQVGACARPTTIGVSYVEHEFRNLAEEQELVWPADGEHAARPHEMQARSLDRAATATEFVLVEQGDQLRQARADYEHAERVLSPYARREPGAKLRYWLGFLVLWLGDASGVGAAAIVNGDYPITAFGQALAAGLAATCASFAGTELKHVRMARGRRRDAASLTADEQRYRSLLAGNDRGLGIVKAVVLLALTVAVLLAVGIFNLRTSIEGDASGLTFGLLAAATATGSVLLGYSSADEVSDLLAAKAKRLRRAERRYLRLARSEPFAARAAAEQAASSIRDEYRMRGQAAAKNIQALTWQVQRQNPEIFGHGFPVGEHPRSITRRAGRDGVE